VAGSGIVAGLWVRPSVAYWWASGQIAAAIVIAVLVAFIVAPVFTLHCD
jgi:hypothetical protein